MFTPDGRPVDHSECWMALALRQRRAFQGQEIVVERPDGARFTVLAHASPFYDAAGRLLGAVNVLVDVTELKRADEARALLASIVESSQDAIVSKTLDGVILSWNGGAERLFGYTAAEAVGRPITLIIPPERYGEETMILGRLRRGERVEHFETVRVAKDGRRLDISLTISPVRDGAGRIVAASKVARDISDRKRAEEALREADRRKDEFLAVLAHELRNPLAPMRNATQVLQEKGPGDGRLEWALAVFDRQLRQMARLIDDLMDVSRISRSKLQLRRERVELAAVVRAAVETSRPLLEAAGHEFTLTLPAEPVLLDADPARLAQALSNLLNNAAKYTERGGRVWLTAERQGSDAVVTVRDTGIGISPEELPRVFETFTQLGRAPAHAHGGLGIGLSLVKALVELHGGRVEAHSDGPGQGSAFTVRLPAIIEAPAGPHLEPARVKPAAARGLRVLVVDDNEDAAATLAMLLRLSGHDVRVAHDGLAALGEAEGFRPEVVLLDIGLPRLGGYEVARKLRARPWGKHAALIALTGWGQERDRQLSREAGFDHHFVKPVDPAVLTDLLAALAQTVALRNGRELAPSG